MNKPFNFSLPGSHGTHVTQLFTNVDKQDTFGDFDWNKKKNSDKKYLPPPAKEVCSITGLVIEAKKVESRCGVDGIYITILTPQKMIYTICCPLSFALAAHVGQLEKRDVALTLIRWDDVNCSFNAKVLSITKSTYTIDPASLIDGCITNMCPSFLGKIDVDRIVFV